jgi:hypothetical protein
MEITELRRMTLEDMKSADLGVAASLVDKARSIRDLRLIALWAVESFKSIRDEATAVKQLAADAAKLRSEVAKLRADSDAGRLQPGKLDARAIASARNLAVKGARLDAAMRSLTNDGRLPRRGSDGRRPIGTE